MIVIRERATKEDYFEYYNKIYEKLTTRNIFDYPRDSEAINTYKYEIL